jgi:signal transduction histidine kinase
VPGWSPSEIAYKDEAVLATVKNLERGRQELKTLAYPGGESQLTWMQKFNEGESLTLILQEPVSALAEAANRIQLQSLIVGLIILVIALNLILLISGKVTKPLVQLAQSMGKVGRGEFSARIKVKSKDEIGKLAGMYNKMLQELEDRDREIDRAKQKLIQSEKMSAFGQMSAGIAHEVKNPLAGILGYAQIVKKKLDDRPELVSHLEIIEKETVRCKEIVENLMRFARQEKAQLQRIDINRTVKDAVRLVEHQISVSGIKITQMYALESAPIFIKGNTNQIQQVMLNLMLNAQHSMESKGTLTVSTHFDEKNQRVMIVVSDTGCGMSGEVQARIFEPFFTTKGVGKGTGLGLSVSIGIVKDHRGAIEVESEVGKGSTFTISLPCDENALGKAEATAGVA